MPEKRLLYFTSNGVSAFGWRAGHLTAEARFANKEESIPEFSRYVRGSAKALYHILVDVVEEDFHQENIPYVRGKDRRTLLGRKLAQRYRDLSLALALSLGYESGPRREEKILFSSFSNTQQFQPWLAALRACKARLVGVFSVPLVTPLVAKKLGVRAERYLLVSLQQGGLRQSYVENGRIRFSRLGRSESSNAEDIAGECASESARIQQYLTNVRIMARDAGPLDVVVLAPSGQMALYRSKCANSPLLQFQVVDMDTACRKAGLRSWPDGLFGERLFLHLLAATPSGDQFAGDEERREYNLWRARIALVSSGAGLFAFCALLAALRFLDVLNITQLARIDSDQERALSTQYARMQAQYPKTPTSAENLKGLVDNYRVLEHQTASLARILGEVSEALSDAPQLELERIEWQVGVSPARTGAAPGSTGPNAAPLPADAPRDYEVVEIAGRVNSAQASDYRAISRVVSDFAEKLRKHPGIEIIGIRLPFDLAAEKSLSGDIGEKRATEIPRFTVLAAKRLGS